MKITRTLLTATAVALFALPTLAEETTASSSELKANLRRLGFEYSTTDVSHAREYADSPYI